MVNVRWVLLFGLVACVDPSSVVCTDYLCPQGHVCVPGGCATPAEVAACNGVADGEACTTSTGTGSCQGGACRLGTCGNGDVDVGEVCDDGNTASGDGCRADCAKLESCGDSRADEGESCDDGNHNPADGCDECVTTEWTASVLVGRKLSATAINAAPQAVTADAAGRMYFFDAGSNRIWRVDPDGATVLVAGNGLAAFGGDGIPATQTSLNNVLSLAVDGFGRLVIADAGNNRIRRIDAFGVITTIAGNGDLGGAGDGGLATLASLFQPCGVAVNAVGEILIADTVNNRIRRVRLDGTIETVAGTGVPGFGGDSGPATDALLQYPYGIAVDLQGNVVVTDVLNSRIRRFVIGGSITTIAGTGTNGYSGDNGSAASAQVNYAQTIAVDATGNVYFDDRLNRRIRRIAGGTITTVAGDGTEGFQGDGGPATSAKLNSAQGVAIDAAGNLLFADKGNFRVRRVDTSGTISTVAATGVSGDGPDDLGALSTPLMAPRGVAIDPMGRIVLTNFGAQIIFRIEPDGHVTRIAGIGRPGFAGDGEPAVNARLQGPLGIAIDSAGNIVFSDSESQRIRKIDTAGVITTIAGTGVIGASGDNGAATSATFNFPTEVAFDGQGGILIADTFNSRIRRVSATGTITTIAGDGTLSCTGDTQAATSATLGLPMGVTVDNQGRVLIADPYCNSVRRIENGIITRIAGNGSGGYSGENVAATSAQLLSPVSVLVGSAGQMWIADQGNQIIRYVDANGMISTVAGIPQSTTVSSDGDGGLATSAYLNYPNMMALTSNALVFADSNNLRIRQIANATGIITSIAGGVDPPATGPSGRAKLADAQALVVANDFTLVAGGAAGVLEAFRSGSLSVVAGRYPQLASTGSLARFRNTTFGSVGGVAYDETSQVIYFTETSADQIWKVTISDLAAPDTWAIALVAGGTGFADGANARFRQPTGLYLDPAANKLYIADTGNNAIRVYDVATRAVTTLVNSIARLGFSGDGGAATAASLYGPTAITRCGGDLFIADTGNQRVRRVDGTNTITTAAGTGVADSSGEGDPAFDFPLDQPRGLACDPKGNVYVTSRSTVRVLLADDNGRVDGSGAIQTIYGAPPRTSFPSTTAQCLTGIAAPTSTTVQVADACSGLLVELSRAPQD